MKINFKGFLTVAFFFAALPSFAQVSIGAQAGAVFSSPKNTYDIGNATYGSESKTGLQAGLVFDVPLGEGGLRFMPELRYVNQGFKLDINTTVNIGTSVPFSITGKTALSFIEVPVNLAYAVDLGSGKLIIGAGPYVGYGLSIKDEVKPVLNGQAVTIRPIEFGTDVKRFDYGANATIGYLFDAGIMIRGNYNLGLAELSTDGATTYKTRYFGASLVYFFKR